VIKLTERTVFINGLPALYEALTKAGREAEAKKILKDFLNSTFASDIDAKVDRFRSLPTGIFDADSPYFRIFWEFNQIYIAGLNYSTVVTAGVLCERICLDILEKNKLAKKESIAEMKKIQKKRNEYVHPKMTATDNQKDALEMVKSISTVLKNECSATP
jgi:hypothetical protein